jgi:hypothetical protein
MKQPYIIPILLLIGITPFIVKTESATYNNTCYDQSLYSYYPQFEFQFRALIFQPTASNLNYAAQAIPVPLPSPNWSIYDINPNYHFGFDLQASTFIQKKNTRLRVNWLRFNHSDSACHNVPSDQDMVGPFFEIGPDAALYKNAKGSVKFHFNNVNINYSQFINICDNFYANLFAGVSFIRLQQGLFSEFANNENSVVRTICVPTQFTGAGPQLGIDLYYSICNNLFFTSKAAASLLTGKLKNHTIYQALSPALEGLDITPPNTQSTCTEDKTQLVPGFDLQLGLSYFLIMCEAYTLQFEAGYQALLYINPIQSIDMGSEVVTPPVIPDTVGVFARTFRGTLSNFGLAGPYVSIGCAF